MEKRNGSIASSTEAIPAGHAALTEAEEHVESQADRAGLAGLSVAALGVVFGDIGTSPVYTFRECFNPERGLSLDAEHVLGILSMIFWALIIVVAIKYVLLIMRADNQGEGGILALLNLSLETARHERSRAFLVLLALGGAALFYGDSMITPAISVLSAVEGLGTVTPALNRFVLPLTVAVLLTLFLFQKRGTESVGRLFGPVMVFWFAVLGGVGAVQILQTPRVLAALNPAHAVGIFVAAPAAGFVVLGAVALAITGGEALYADMGHFGRFPIRVAWFALVLPALVLNYFGQGALVLNDQGGNRQPVLPHGTGLGVIPTGAAVHPGHGHCLASGNLRRLLAVATSRPTRPDAAARYLSDLDPGARANLYSTGQLAAPYCRPRPGLRVSKLQRIGLRLWLCNHRHNDHHNCPCRSGLPRRLALAMANDCGGAATDCNRRPRAIRRKCAEDPKWRLVRAGDRACRLYDYDHLAHRTSIGDGAVDEPDGAARPLYRNL